MRNHYILKLITVALAFHATSSVVVQSEEHVSSVRRAAIDKLQNKLGTMRGSIKPKQKRVYLTPIMIEQLKPITSQSHLVAKQLVEEKTAAQAEIDYHDILPDFVISPVSEGHAIALDVPKVQIEQAVELAKEAVEISNENIPAPITKLEKGQTTEPKAIAVSQPDDIIREPIRPQIRITERSERLRREIFSAIRMKQAKSAPTNRLVTNSIASAKDNSDGNGTRSPLPNTSDVDVLLKAVNEMIANGN